MCAYVHVLHKMTIYILHVGPILEAPVTEPTSMDPKLINISIC